MEPWSSLYIGRKRNSQINHSSPANTANQSSEKVEDRAHETGPVKSSAGSGRQDS